MFCETLFRSGRSCNKKRPPLKPNHEHCIGTLRVGPWLSPRASSHCPRHNLGYHAMKEGSSATPEGWQQTMAMLIAPLKTLSRTWLAVFLETSTAGFYRAHRFQPQHGPYVEATVEAIGGFTGHTCCEPPIDLQMLRGMALHDRNIGSQRVGSIISMTTNFVLWAAFVCAGWP